MAAQTAAIQYQLEHWGDDRGPAIVAGSVILMVVTALAVALRLVAQKMIKTKFDIDDYLIIVAMVLCLGLCANTIICVHYGIGKHLIRAVKTDSSPPDKLVNLFKAIWAEGFLWALEIPLVKIAILLFYRRVFTGNQRWFRWAFWLTLIYAVLWGVATFIIVIVQCLPVPFFWNQAYAFYDLKPPDTGKCLVTRPSQVPPALLNCVGDAVLLLLPFPVLWRLQMNLRRKLEITAIFGLGIFVLVASIIRLRFIWLDENSGDPTYQDAETLVWTPVECCVGVICACIPCMAPLRRSLFFKRSRAGYQTTGSKRIKDLPLTAIHTWPGEHSVHRSTHTRNDDESGEFGEEGWASKMDGGNSKVSDEALRTQLYAPNWKSVVVNGASADPRESGMSEDSLPNNRIKVSRDLAWSSETVKEQDCC